MHGERESVCGRVWLARNKKKKTPREQKTNPRSQSGPTTGLREGATEGGEKIKTR